jgi:hypothetical protein
LARTKKAKDIRSIEEENSSDTQYPEKKKCCSEHNSSWGVYTKNRKVMDFARLCLNSVLRLAKRGTGYRS